MHAAMKGYGYRLQYSVFVCDLHESEKLDLRLDLGGLMNRVEDQVCLIDLGPLAENPAWRFEFMGPPSALPETGPRVL